MWGRTTKQRRSAVKRKAVVSAVERMQKEAALDRALKMVRTKTAIDVIKFSERRRKVPRRVSS